MARYKLYWRKLHWKLSKYLGIGEGEEGWGQLKSLELNKSWREFSSCLLVFFFRRCTKLFQVKLNIFFNFEKNIPKMQKTSPSKLSPLFSRQTFPQPAINDSHLKLATQFGQPLPAPALAFSNENRGHFRVNLNKSSHLLNGERVIGFQGALTLFLSLSLYPSANGQSVWSGRRWLSSSSSFWHEHS